MVVRVLCAAGPNGPVACFAYGRCRLCGAYSGGGWAPPYLCVWSGHLAAGRFLCTAPGGLWPLAYSVCAWVLCGAFFARRSGPISGHGWGLWRGAYSVRGFGFILFVMRWIKFPLV